ncbi:hypothetical protein [Lacinutrix algicola]|uniref:hypothetical protein n=1 Tax=Lacinutrix algicola TaxID=342954 RepID=UPI0006E2B949|nr:hypothetical protein [Lacinutrix algicola]
MKKLLIAFCLLALCACGKEKSVLLPEIENAKITEITDVSPAYIFYDETKPDSLELNKGNLIISTNWLVNVDRRLTLKQVMPSIIKLQEKKRNSSHKNESARNYYTCNDTSIKNLGFLDFTDVVYLLDGKYREKEIENNCNFTVEDLNNIIVNIDLGTDNLQHKFKIEDLESILKKTFLKELKIKRLVYLLMKRYLFRITSLLNLNYLS